MGPQNQARRNQCGYRPDWEVTRPNIATLAGSAVAGAGMFRQRKKKSQFMGEVATDAEAFPGGARAAFGGAGVVTPELDVGCDVITGIASQRPAGERPTEQAPRRVSINRSVSRSGLREKEAAHSGSNDSTRHSCQPARHHPPSICRWRLHTGA